MILHRDEGSQLVGDGIVCHNTRQSLRAKSVRVRRTLHFVDWDRSL